MAADEIEIAAVNPRDPRAVEALTAYTVEVRDTAGLEALDVAAALADVDGFMAAGGCFLLAICGERPVGCVGLRALNAQDAEIKRMWVAPDLRGSGLAVALLGQCESRARAGGYARLVLDTHASLVRALRFYAAHGYRQVPRYNDNPDATHFFAKELTAADPA